MAIKSVDHMTINCKDVSKSFVFYEDILGLKRLDDVDMGDHVLHYFQLPSVRLELIEYKSEQTARSCSNTDIGIYRHMALVTDDLKEISSRINSSDYKMNLPPTYIPQLGKIVMLIVDPNGVEIELIQA